MNIYRRRHSGVAGRRDSIYFWWRISSVSLVVPARDNKLSRPRTDNLAASAVKEPTRLPPALLPGNKNDPDADGAWTGSLIEADGVYHLFYKLFRKSRYQLYRQKGVLQTRSNRLAERHSTLGLRGANVAQIRYYWLLGVVVGDGAAAGGGCSLKVNMRNFQAPPSRT
jgi:hypothetical protein